MDKKPIEDRDLVESVTYYFISPMFIVQEHLGVYQLTRKVVRDIINEFNKNSKLVKFISAKEILTSSSQIKPLKGFVTEDTVKIIKQTDMSQLTVLDPEYTLKKGRIFSFVSDKMFNFGIDIEVVLEDGSVKRKTVKGVFFFYLLMHIAGTAVLSLIVKLNREEIFGNLGDYLICLRYLLQGELVEPFEFSTQFHEALKGIFNVPEDKKIRNFSASFSLELVVGEEKKSIKKPPGNFLYFILGKFRKTSFKVVKQDLERSILKSFRFKKSTKISNATLDNLSENALETKQDIPKEPTTLFNYIHIKLNPKFASDLSAKAGEDNNKTDKFMDNFKRSIFRKLSASAIYNQVIKEDIVSQFKLKDPREEVEIYHLSPIILEFDSRRRDPLDVIFKRSLEISDFAVFLMLNVIAILFITLRKFDEMIESDFKFEMGKGSAERALYQTLLSQRAFLAVTAEYNNIRFIGPEPYDLLYDELKKSFKLEEYFDMINNKLSMLGAIKQREHYVTLKRHEGSKKKLFLVVQVLAFLLTVFNVLNLLVHTWGILTFSTIQLEILFYMGTTAFVISLSLFLFVTMDKYVQISQYFEVNRLWRVIFVLIWLSSVIVGGITTYYNETIGTILYLTLSVITLLLWLVDYHHINKKIEKFQLYLDAITRL